MIHSRAQQGHHRPKTPAPRLSAYNANGTSGARGRSAPSRPNWRRRCADCAYQSTNGCEPAEPPGKPAALPQAGGLWLRQRRPSGREFGAPTGHGHQDPAAGRQPAGRGNLLPASHRLGMPRHSTRLLHQWRRKIRPRRQYRVARAIRHWVESQMGKVPRKTTRP